MPGTLLQLAPRPRLRNFATLQSTVTPPIVLVQSATSTNSTPFTTNSATFPKPVKAGNILWAAIGCDKQDPIRSVPAGFQAIMSHASASVSIWVGWKIADGTETTVTLVHEVGTDAAGDSMWIGEFASADNPDNGVWQILGKATAPTDESTPLAATSGTTAAVPNSGGALAFFAWDTITTLADLTTYTNGFVQIQGALAAGGRAGLYVALGNGINRNALVETTQTRANSDQCSACVVVFNKVPAPVVVPDWPRQVVHPGVQPSPRGRFVPYLLGATDSGTPPAVTATGSIDLAGTVTAQAAATVSGALSLTGTVTAQAPATASGSLTLAGTAAWAVPAVAGSLTLTGAATTAAPVTASGSITLTGSATATGPGTTAAGSLTLTATVTGQAAATATGAVALTGTVTARAAAISAGTVTLTATVSAGARATAITGSIILTGLIQISGVPVTVTGTDRSTTTVSGTDIAAATIAGSDRATAGITSSDRPAATVSGTDRATAVVTSS